MLTLDRVKKTFTNIQRSGLGTEVKLIHAVNDISLQINRAERFGIVGESGSGKSTLGRLIVGLEKPNAGTITHAGQRVDLNTSRARKAYWKQVQIIFQDPFSSLNPRMRVGSILAEPMRNYGVADYRSMQERVSQCLNLVGLASDVAQRYPHELSGGQRQRVAIAAALAVEPDVIVADEAVSALDVSVQAQIVNLLRDLGEQLGLTYIFITHDLNLSVYFCDRVAVMYLGQVMEVCEARALLERPLHPYTQALISAVPSVNAFERRERIKLQGEIPSPIDPPSGCPFNPRCPIATQECRTTRPALRPASDVHSVACHHVDLARDHSINSMTAHKE